ncbi:MAG: tRNA-dihydrouridine synthase family protein [Planctomycetota bacterium]
MSCETASKNATAPEPGVAPGLGRSADDALRAAERLERRWSEHGVDGRLADLIPGMDAPFFQAGLAGYSDAAMRLIARRLGCPLCITEALLDRTLLAGGRGFAKADLGDLADNVPGGADDAPLLGQIMGSEPAEMAAAAVKMVEQGARADREYRDLAYDDLTTHKVKSYDNGTSAFHCSPSASPTPNPTRTRTGYASIDLNIACPVKKIKSKARGGHWLAQPQGAIDIIEAVRDALPASVPVTLKMRRSFDDTPEMAENFFRIFDAAYDLGVAFVTVHGRSVQQKYIGPSRWDILRDIVKRKHPGRVKDRLIFTSGDVWTAEDIPLMLDYTGSHAASVARGCIGNPWIFRQARQLFAGQTPTTPTLEEQRGVLEDHFGLALAANARLVRHAESFTGRTMRKFGIRFAQHHPDAELVRKRFIEVDSTESWQAVLDDHYGSAVVGTCIGHAPRDF